MTGDTQGCGSCISARYRNHIQPFLGYSKTREGGFLPTAHLPLLSKLCYSFLFYFLFNSLFTVGLLITINITSYQPAEYTQNTT